MKDILKKSSNINNVDLNQLNILPKILYNEELLKKWIAIHPDQAIFKGIEFYLKTGILDYIKELLKHKVKINFKNKNILNIVIKLQDSRLINILGKTNPLLLTYEIFLNAIKKCPLHIIEALPREKVLEYLSKKDSYGKLPIQYVLENNLGILSFLLGLNPNINNQNLIYAARNVESNSFEELLRTFWFNASAIQRKDLMNFKDNHDSSILDYIVELHPISALEIVLTDKPCINAQQLHKTLIKDKYAALKNLLENGEIDKNILKFKIGNTTLGDLFALSKNLPSEIYNILYKPTLALSFPDTWLMNLAKSTSKDKLLRILPNENILKEQVKVCSENSENILFLLIKYGHIECAKALKDKYNLNINLLTNNNETPLTALVNNGKEEAIHLFKEWLNHEQLTAEVAGALLTTLCKEDKKAFLDTWLTNSNCKNLTNTTYVSQNGLYPAEYCIQNGNVQLLSKILDSNIIPDNKKDNLIDYSLQVKNTNFAIIDLLLKNNYPFSIKTLIDFIDNNDDKMLDIFKLIINNINKFNIDDYRLIFRDGIFITKFLENNPNEFKKSIMTNKLNFPSIINNIIYKQVLSALFKSNDNSLIVKAIDAWQIVPKNSLDDEGNSILHLAATSKDIQLLKCLSTKKGIADILKITNKENYTPIDIAVLNNNLSFFMKSLKIKDTEMDGLIPNDALDIAIQKPPSLLDIEFLLSKNSRLSPNNIIDLLKTEYISTAEKIAILKNKEVYSTDAKNILNYKNIKELVIIAIKSIDKQLSKFIIENFNLKKSLLIFKDRYSGSLLHYISKECSPLAVEILISNIREKDIVNLLMSQDSYGRTSLMTSLQEEGRNNNMFFALQELACKYIKNKHTLQKLYAKQDNKGKQIIHYIIDNGDSEILKDFYEACPEAFMKEDKNAKVPFDYALKVKKCKEFFIENGLISDAHYAILMTKACVDNDSSAMEKYLTNLKVIPDINFTPSIFNKLFYKNTAYELYDNAKNIYKHIKELLRKNLPITKITPEKVSKIANCLKFLNTKIFQAILKRLIIDGHPISTLAAIEKACYTKVTAIHSKEKKNGIIQGLIGIIATTLGATNSTNKYYKFTFSAGLACSIGYTLWKVTKNTTMPNLLISYNNPTLNSDDPAIKKMDQKNDTYSSIYNLNNLKL